jgi:hypothetical protein
MSRWRRARDLVRLQARVGHESERAPLIGQASLEDPRLARPRGSRVSRAWAASRRGNAEGIALEIFSPSPSSELQYGAENNLGVVPRAPREFAWSASSRAVTRLPVTPDNQLAPFEPREKNAVEYCGIPSAGPENKFGHYVSRRIFSRRLPFKRALPAPASACA